MARLFSDRTATRLHRAYWTEGHRLRLLLASQRPDRRLLARDVRLVHRNAWQHATHTALRGRALPVDVGQGIELTLLTALAETCAVPMEDIVADAVAEADRARVIAKGRLVMRLAELDRLSVSAERPDLAIEVAAQFAAVTDDDEQVERLRSRFVERYGYLL